MLLGRHQPPGGGVVGADVGVVPAAVGGVGPDGVVVGPGRGVVSAAVGSHPSMGTLPAIATSLGGRMAELFHTIETSPADGGEEAIVTRAEAQEVMRSGTGGERRVILSDVGRGYELAENRYEPGTESATAPVHHEEYEFGFVLEGELEVTVDGRPFVVRAGDAVPRPHRFYTPEPHHARTLWVNLTEPDGKAS